MPDSYSDVVAGPSMWFMIANIAFYWLLVIMCELKFFEKIFCRERSSVINEKFDHISNDSIDVDLDINDEAERV